VVRLRVLFAVDSSTGEVRLPRAIHANDIENNVVWLDASNGTHTDSGGSLSNFNDVSGQNNDAEQLTPANQPLIIVEGLNERDAISFDGINDYLTIAHATSISDMSVEERTVNLTLRTSDDVSRRQVLFEEGDAANGFNIYLDNGSLYAGAWSVGNGWNGCT